MRTEITDELRRLAGLSGGTLRPEEVVASATAETSPLHSQFEWDDSIAGERYRLMQARRLIRVSIEFVNEPPIKTNVFVSLMPDRRPAGDGYRLTTDVLQHPGMRRQLLEDAMAEMRRFQIKFANLRELAAVFSAMQETQRDLTEEGIQAPAPVTYVAVEHQPRG